MVRRVKTTVGRVVVAAVAAALISQAGAARAQTCRTPHADGPVELSEVPERLEYIEGVLKREQRKASWWNWGWGLGFGALAVGQGSVALITDDTENQRTFGGNAVRTGIAALNQVVVPLRIPELELKDKSCRALAAAERALENASRAERKQVALFVPRIGSLFLNFGVGIFLLANDQATDAIIATASGLIVSEIRFQTTPFGAVDAHENYKRGIMPSSKTASSGPEWLLLPSVAGNPSGMTLLVRY